jgi:TRAP-type transport system small permease protein
MSFNNPSKPRQGRGPANAFDRAIMVYDRIVRFLVRVAELLALAIMFFLAIAMNVAVFFRFVLNTSIGWSDELSSLLLAVMMFLVIGIGLHDRLHIAVGILLEQLSPVWQRVLDIAIHVVCAGFFGLIAIEGYKVAQMGMGMALATLPLQRGMFFYAIPIGSGFAVMVCINNILRVARGWDHPRLGGLD